MIFDEILNKENNFTEILKNLCKLKLFKKEFLQFLSIEYQNIDDVVIESQYKLSHNSKDNGIVDMYIENDKNEIYLIEIKINPYTNLTDHQKSGDYLEFANNTNLHLIFLIPKNYRFIEHLKILNDVKIKYLDSFMKTIKNESGLYEINQYIKDFIDFYYEYLWIERTYQFTLKELQLIKRERMSGIDLTKDFTIPQLIHKLFKVIEDIAYIVGYINTKSKVEQYSDWYGYYLKENELIWFGVDFAAWKQFSLPISIQIDENINNLDNNLQKILLEKEKFKIFDYDGNKYLIYNFTLEELKNLDNMIEKIYKTRDIFKNILLKKEAQ